MFLLNGISNKENVKYLGLVARSRETYLDLYDIIGKSVFPIEIYEKNCKDKYGTLAFDRDGFAKGFVSIAKYMVEFIEESELL